MFNACHLTCQIASSVLSDYNFKVLRFVRNKTGEQGTFVYGDENRIPAPEIQITKLNPTKYLYRVRHAPSSFLLRLNENFDPGWKLFISPPQHSNKNGLTFDETLKSPLGTLGSREIDLAAEGKFCHEADCQGKEILQLKASLKLASTQAKFRKRLDLNPLLEWPENFHWKSDGYSNAWFIDFNLLKAMRNNIEGLYLPDESGSITLNVVVEYSPQRLHFIGLAVSLFSFGLIILVLLFSNFKKFITSSQKGK